MFTIKIKKCPIKLSFIDTVQANDDIEKPNIVIIIADDLQKDEWELNNLINDPQHAVRIEYMKSQLVQWMEQQGDRGILMDVVNPENKQKDVT